MNSPIDIFKSIGGKMDPQQLVMSMLTQNMNPLLSNVIQMAKNGDSKGVEEFARNLCKGQGRDFDKEFNEFIKNFK